MHTPVSTVASADRETLLETLVIQAELGQDQPYARALRLSMPLTLLCSSTPSTN
jgi:hypothetical protein